MDVYRDTDGQYLVVVSGHEDEVYWGPGDSLVQIFIDGPDGTRWDANSLPQQLHENRYEWVNPEDGRVVELTRLQEHEYTAELTQNGRTTAPVVTPR